jgi:endonuclease YncB( thermonuclease family)
VFSKITRYEDKYYRKCVEGGVGVEVDVWGRNKGVRRVGVIVEQNGLYSQKIL